MIVCMTNWEKSNFHLLFKYIKMNIDNACTVCTCMCFMCVFVHLFNVKMGK